MNDFQNVDNLIFDAIKCLNSGEINKVSDFVENILNNTNYFEAISKDNWQLFAHILLVSGKLKEAKEVYTKASNIEGIIFASILMRDLASAELYLNKLSLSPASIWCRFLFELFSVENKVKTWTKYFVIRQFMEFTVYCLLLYKNNDYVQLLIKNLNKLSKINSDSEKLIGYAHFQFGLLDEAILFLSKALKRDKFDGEIYYKLGQIYVAKNQLKEALAALENAKLFLPDHYATKALIEKINSSLKNKL